MPIKFQALCKALCSEMSRTRPPSSRRPPVMGQIVASESIELHLLIFGVEGYIYISTGS